MSEIAINVNTKQVCPIMVDLFNEGVSEGRIDKEKQDDQFIAELATAHIAIGLLLLDQIGVNLEHMLSASRMCADAFMRAVDASNKRKTESEAEREEK